MYMNTLQVWPGLSVYPDFTLGYNATQWWYNQCEDFYNNWRVEYDALWIVRGTSRTNHEQRMV